MNLAFELALIAIALGQHRDRPALRAASYVAIACSLVVTAAEWLPL